MLNLSLMLCVRVLGKIVEQSLLRTAHDGIVPVVVILLESFQTGRDGIDMVGRSILVVVKVSLEYQGVIAFHGKLISLFLFGSLGTVVEIEATSADDGGKDDGHNDSGKVLLLSRLLRLGVVPWRNVTTIAAVVVDRRYWGCKS
jgi:hypothetical protein